MDLFRGGFDADDMSIAELGTTTLKREWKELIEEFPDRFMFGTDIGPGDRHLETAEIARWYREALRDLEPDVAEMVAHKNAERLFFPSLAGR